METLGLDALQKLICGESDTTDALLRENTTDPHSFLLRRRVLRNAPQRLEWLAAEAYKGSLQELVYAISYSSNARLTEESPVADGAMDRGEVILRWQVVIPPLSPNPQVNIRRLAKAKAVSLDKYGNEVAKILKANAFGNLLVAGPTGSGKTTLLRALLETFPPTLHLLILQDTPELTLEHSNTDYFYTTPQLGLEHLLIAALRAAPDVIVVGEARSKTHLEYMREVATTHPCAATMHALTADDVRRRIDDLPPCTIVIMSEPSIGLGVKTIIAANGDTLFDHRQS